MNKILRYSFVALLAMVGWSNALADTTDELTASSFGIPDASNATYADFTATGTSGAKYAVQAYGKQEYIQIRSNNSNSGIIVTASGGYVKSITIAYNTEKTGDKAGEIDVYAKDEAYSTPADLYGDNKGTKVGQITATTTTYEFTKGYKFFGLRSTNGARYIDKVTVVWTDKAPSGGGDDPGVTTTGDGTLANPYTVADALAVAGTLEQGSTSTNSYYIKGKISSISNTFDTQHGTAIFSISDDGQAANEFLCYSVKFLENKAWLDGNTQIAVSDEVIVYGPLKNYNGTLETGSGAYLYSLNGVTQNTGGQEQAATPVASIADMLNVTSPSTNLELTLTNAKVLFNDGNYIYMRENGKAICFYKFTDLKETAKNNALVSGKVKVDYEVFKNLPEVTTNTKTDVSGLSITESEEEAEPVQTTLDVVAAGTYVCDLVQVTATLKKETNGTTTTYKLASGSTEIVVVNNSKGLDKIEADTEITAVGIVNTNNSLYQMKLTKKVADPSGISTVTADQLMNAPAYNVGGQRVNQGYKGLVIKGGKKLIQK